MYKLNSLGIIASLISVSIFAMQDQETQKMQMKFAVNRLNALSVHKIIDTMDINTLSDSLIDAQAESRWRAEMVRCTAVEIKQLKVDQERAIDGNCDPISCKELRITCFEYMEQYGQIRHMFPPLLRDHFMDIARKQAAKRITAFCKIKKKEIESPKLLQEEAYRQEYGYGYDSEGKEPADVYEQVKIAHNIQQEIEQALEKLRKNK